MHARHSFCALELRVTHGTGAVVQMAIGGIAAVGCTGAMLQMDAKVLDVITLDGGRRMRLLVQKAAARRPL